ncbi:MAG: winged helix-turn-helix transcriptional regulator [Candidatus Binataceae bacterium]|nr:winged helix-turn-helix transcriptional regulator [Candidatus Binataceae bacterium]
MNARAAHRPNANHGELSDAALALVATRFRAMGEPIRLRMLRALERGEQSVSALTEAIGSTQPNISKHLKVLQDVGLVNRRQEGSAAHYSIADPMVFELCDIVCSRLRAQLEEQVEALGRGAGPRRRA